ncbi:hypothetical protein [Demequina aurantiaca]|uniref:hypothetical protein n=1 Tax=Demequina aurantiaca TaxID=676200 RepID=UPI000781236A|nr:hypothetical protein [Demequina aurantiaca]
MDVLLEAIGWVGSILIVWSLMQARVLRFRWMNFAGAFVATVYNGVIGIWPFAFMNAAITIIDAYWLVRLYRERDDAEVYEVLSVEPEDAFLQHVLAVHGTDIAKHQPAFTAHAPADGAKRSTFLVTRGDEAVGVVVVADQGAGVGLVELDWVKERFRDFAPGEFVYRSSSALSDAGFTRLEREKHAALDEAYVQKVGFRSEGDRWVREVTTPAPSAE